MSTPKLRKESIHDACHDPLEFNLKAECVEVLHSPSAFYDKICEMIREAKKRIVLCSLYIGHTTLEDRIVDLIGDNVKNNKNLQVLILLDAQRAIRTTVLKGSKIHKNSIYTLTPLLDADKEGNQITVRLWLSPNSTKIQDTYMHTSLRELLGVQHMKAIVSDDKVIITGANLEKSYFTDRQDRYMVVDFAPLADAVTDLIGCQAELGSCLREFPGFNFDLIFPPRVPHPVHDAIGYKREVSAKWAKFHERWNSPSMRKLLDSFQGDTTISIHLQAGFAEPPFLQDSHLLEDILDIPDPSVRFENLENSKKIPAAEKQEERDDIVEEIIGGDRMVTKSWGIINEMGGTGDRGGAGEKEEIETFLKNNDESIKISKKNDKIMKNKELSNSDRYLMKLDELNTILNKDKNENLKKYIPATFFHLPIYPLPDPPREPINRSPSWRRPMEHRFNSLVFSSGYLNPRDKIILKLRRFLENEDPFLENDRLPDYITYEDRKYLEERPDRKEIIKGKSTYSGYMHTVSTIFTIDPETMSFVQNKSQKKDRLKEIAGATPLLLTPPPKEITEVNFSPRFASRLTWITAAPEANAFFGGGFLKQFIPFAYSMVSAEAIAKTGGHEWCLEYQRCWWTFHGKGLWLYENKPELPLMYEEDLFDEKRKRKLKAKDEKLRGLPISSALDEFDDPNLLIPEIDVENCPWGTVIGSSNFGERSHMRDLEMSFFLRTSNPKLRKALHKEVTLMVKHCRAVDAVQMRSRVPYWLGVALGKLRFLKSYL
eukprot:GHVL01002250.1.p1 GENE.GHVL01002250.1~~GHVL01002250.1.p1  ORF type:complete len:771 (+),score=172.34 GHVL01002250.1:113-2425(+)